MKRIYIYICILSTNLMSDKPTINNDCHGHALRRIAIYIYLINKGKKEGVRFVV